VREQVRHTIRKYRMLSMGDTVVVGVSGGPDSVALLHLLLSLRDEYQLTLHVAHLNHRFRQASAEADARHVEDLCAQWGIPCTIRDQDVPKAAKAAGLSLEEAGRIARYALFDEVAQQVGARRIAVAHHQDDQAETVLLHLLRGSGMEGLAGMAPVRDGTIIRPLLEVTRQDIETYCRKEGLVTRTDETNLEPEYLRNRIRLELIPMLERIYNPGLREALGRTASILQGDNQVIQEIVNQKMHMLGHMEEGVIFFDRSGFLSQPEAIQRRLVREGIGHIQGHRRRLGLAHVDRFLAMVNQGGPGRRYPFPGGIWGTVSYDQIWLSRDQGETEDETQPVPIPGNVWLKEMDWHLLADDGQTDAGIPEDSSLDQVLLDPDKVILPLKVRTRRAGDRINLPAEAGRKKVKDVLMEGKVPRPIRERIPMVVDATDRILWIPGLRCDGTATVDAASTRWLRLRVIRERTEDTYASRY